MSKEIQTEDSQEYNFIDVSTNQTILKFKVKAAHDAHIALSSANDQEATPIIEIFIGGWNNAKCAIRRDRTKPDRAEAETPDVLSDAEFRGFWVKWDTEGKIEVGRDGEDEAFLNYVDPEPFDITHYGVRTSWGASGEWEIENAEPESPGEAVWIAVSDGTVPDDAVCGGSDHDCDLIVARALHEGELLPGKFVPTHGVCYVSWGGEEHRKDEFEVLCGCKPNWVHVNEGVEIPLEALPGGRTIDGETLYIGRVEHEGTVTLGKVHPSHNTCYIPYGGAELGFPEYEILVRQ